MHVYDSPDLVTRKFDLNTSIRGLVNRNPVSLVTLLKGYGGLLKAKELTVPSLPRTNMNDPRVKNGNGEVIVVVPTGQQVSRTRDALGAVTTATTREEGRPVASSTSNGTSRSLLRTSVSAAAGTDRRIVVQNGVRHNEERLSNGRSTKSNAGKWRVCRIASDLGWGSENEGDKDGKSDTSVESARSYPSRPQLDQEKPPPWDSDYSGYTCNIPVTRTCVEDVCDPGDCEILYRESEDPGPVTNVETNTMVSRTGPDDAYRPLDREDLPGKPFRCYHRRRARPVTADVTKTDETETAERSKQSDAPVCVISQVVGNAQEAFSGDRPREEVVDETDPSVITLKKTNDITKIKGWRRKQFFVERPTTVEFYRLERGRHKRKINLPSLDIDEEPGNVENAFVCDSLDAFLDQEAELKVNYEIPHLYAEVGIKLTSEDVVSKPNLTTEDVKEVGSRYCVDLPPPPDIVLLDEVECKKREKRRAEDVFDSYKVIKLDKNRRRTIKVEPKPEVSKSVVHKPVGSASKPVKVKSERTSEPSSDGPGDGEGAGSDMTDLPDGLVYSTKLIGVVVYPSPTRPLHPVVRSHLNKIRAYRTRIDRNWADFATTALVPSRSGGQAEPDRARRKILPVFCTGTTERPSEAVTTEVKKVVDFLVDSVSETEEGEPARTSCQRREGDACADGETTTMDPGPVGRSCSRSSNCSGVSNASSFSSSSSQSQTGLKECRVVLSKINFAENYRFWCMVHERYNCSLCGLAYPRKKFGGEVAANRPQPSSAIVNFKQALLAKKLETVASKGHAVTGIGFLRNLTTNAVELVRLNHVKESFHSGRIQIWLVTSQSSRTRSRAFVTLSKTAPVSKAVNVRDRDAPLKAFPKVISEIVSRDVVFDGDEYAILHCNGTAWEIHGSVNVARERQRIADPDKTRVEVEQVFIPVPLQEMETVRKLAAQVLDADAVKWWILDLSQRFTEIVLNVSNVPTVIPKKQLLSIIRSQFSGFLAVKKRRGRSHGVYILGTLLPFVLIGPYHVFEDCSVLLRSNNSDIPFVYRSVNGMSVASGPPPAAPSYTLKHFVNSVVAGLESGNERKLVGLWLYDKHNLTEECYLETIASTDHGAFPKSDYSIETEHGYGLNSLTNVSLLEPSSDMVKSKHGNIKFEVRVYLYFEMVELGYIPGDLQLDNSIVIDHPLSPGVKIKSQRIGDLVIGLLRKRIQFIPSNYIPLWFITKHVDDLRNRRPFNKYCLDGTHILCKNGLTSLLGISEKRMAELGLKKQHVNEAVSQCNVIQEVLALKKLRKLVLKDAQQKVSMADILKLATSTIHDLEQANKVMARTKSCEQMTEVDLWSQYNNLLQDCRVDDGDKLRSLYRTEDYLSEKMRGLVADRKTKHLNCVIERLEFCFSVIQDLERGWDERNPGKDLAEIAAERKAMTTGVDKALSLVLQQFEYGRSYLKKLETCDAWEAAIQPKTEFVKISPAGTDKTDSNEVPIRKPENVNGKPVDGPKPSGSLRHGRRRPKSSDKRMIRKLERKLFGVCETLKRTDNTANVPEYRRLIKQLDLISSQIRSLKSLFGTGQNRKTFGKWHRTRRKLGRKALARRTRVSGGCAGTGVSGPDPTDKPGTDPVDSVVRPGESGTDNAVVADDGDGRTDTSVSDVPNGLAENSKEEVKDGDGARVRANLKTVNLGTPFRGKKFVVLKKAKTNKMSMQKYSIVKAFKVFESDSGN